ncbi:MAG: hypothetical protein JXM79_18380, partial [Sedimentisphaerales bacterium]|nr:hypothetical protein [Sedimentisphaerales bacterium]
EQPLGNAKHKTEKFLISTHKLFNRARISCRGRFALVRVESILPSNRGLEARATKLAKGFLVKLFEKHGPADVSPETPDLTHSHRPHDLDELIVPCSDKIGHTSDSVLEVEGL